MPERVLVVDDDEVLRAAILDHLRSQGYDCQEAASAEDAVRLALLQPPAVALVDIYLPSGDGLDVLATLHALDGDLPVIIMTGHPSTDTAVRSLRLRAYDYLAKPFRLRELSLRVVDALRARADAREQSADQGQTVREPVVEDIYDARRLLLGSIEAICNALEAKDKYTRGHSKRVAALGRRLAQELGMLEWEIERVGHAGALHDVGKIGIRESILNKPDRLTAAEWHEVRRHPEVGEQILRPILELRDVLDAVRHHHERADGLGYPDGVNVSGLPPITRIIAVADSYDAMASQRAYRDAFGAHYIAAELSAHKGRQWSPDVVGALFRVKPELDHPPAPSPGGAPPISPPGPPSGNPP
jgi:putative two-component system response regulator